VKDARDRYRVREEASRLSHAAIRVDGLKGSCVEKGVPVGHVDEGILDLGSGIFELGEPPARPKIVVVLVDLAQRVADLEMLFVVRSPVLLAAVYRDAAVGALKVDSLRKAVAVLGMGTARMLSDVGGTLSDFGDRGLCKRVEKVVLGQHPFLPDSVLLRLGPSLWNILSRFRSNLPTPKQLSHKSSYRSASRRGPAYPGGGGWRGGAWSDEVRPRPGRSV